MPKAPSAVTLLGDDGDQREERPVHQEHLDRALGHDDRDPRSAAHFSEPALDLSPETLLIVILALASPGDLWQGNPGESNGTDHIRRDVRDVGNLHAADSNQQAPQCGSGRTGKALRAGIHGVSLLPKTFGHELRECGSVRRLVEASSESHQCGRNQEQGERAARPKGEVTSNPDDAGKVTHDHHSRA